MIPRKIRLMIFSGFSTRTLKSFVLPFGIDGDPRRAVSPADVCGLFVFTQIVYALVIEILDLLHSHSSSAIKKAGTNTCGNGFPQDARTGQTRIRFRLM